MFTIPHSARNFRMEHLYRKARHTASEKSPGMSRPANSVLFSLLLGGALRLYGLGSESLWLDEANTARRLGLTFKELFFDTGSASQLPLYYWMTKAWCTLAGTGEVALRFPALVFGLLAIPAVFFLGRELLDDAVGAWGAFFMAINPYFIHYSQEARPYTLFALLALVAWLFLVRWIRSRKTADLTNSMFATAGVLYTHPFGVLILPTLLAVLLLYSPREGGRLTVPGFRWFWRGLELVGILYLPLLYRVGRELLLKLDGGSAGAWLPDPGWTAPFETAGHYFMSPWPALWVLGLTLFVFVRDPGKDRQGRSFLVFVASVWAIFTAAPWLISVTITPLFYHRFTIPVLPLLLILFGLALTRLRSFARWMSVAAVVVLTAIPVFSFHTKVDKPTWREALETMNDRLSPGDLIIRDPGWLKPLTAYYLHPPPGVHQLSPYSVTDLEEPLGSAREVWVITMEDGEVGVEGLLRSGTIPGWVLLSRQPLPETSRKNPHALSLHQMTIARFEREDPNQILAIVHRLASIKLMFPSPSVPGSG